MIFTMSQPASLISWLTHATCTNEWRKDTMPRNRQCGCITARSTKSKQSESCYCSVGKRFDVEENNNDHRKCTKKSIGSSTNPTMGLSTNSSPTESCLDTASEMNLEEGNLENHSEDSLLTPGKISGSILHKIILIIPNLHAANGMQHTLDGNRMISLSRLGNYIRTIYHSSHTATCHSEVEFLGETSRSGLASILVSKSSNCHRLFRFQTSHTMKVGITGSPLGPYLVRCLQ